LLACIITTNNKLLNTLQSQLQLPPVRLERDALQIGVLSQRSRDGEISNRFVNGNVEEPSLQPSRPIQ
jgi:hypothetical protein